MDSGRSYERDFRFMGNGWSYGPKAMLWAMMAIGGKLWIGDEVMKKKCYGQ